MVSANSGGMVGRLAALALLAISGSAAPAGPPVQAGELTAAQSAATDDVPSPHKGGPNSDGQYWTVTFRSDGSITVTSTCKRWQQAAHPGCSLTGTGTWVRKLGMPCYTITGWEGGATGNPEQCIAADSETLASPTAITAGKDVPPPYRGGPAKNGQIWLVTFNPGGTLIAVSTCKPEGGAADPVCRIIGTGTWARKADNTVCYTIREWGGNPQYANPEKCLPAS